MKSIFLIKNSMLIVCFWVLAFMCGNVFSQKPDTPKKDSVKVKNLNEVIISAPRTNIPLDEMPGCNFYCH